MLGKDLVRQSEPEDMLTPETHEQKNKIEHRRSRETHEQKRESLVAILLYCGHQKNKTRDFKQVSSE